MANRLISEILKNRDRCIYPINKIDLSLFFDYHARLSISKKQYGSNYILLSLSPNF